MSNARFFFLYRYLLENTCEGHTAKGEDIRAQYENHEFGSDIRSVYRDIHQLNAPATGLEVLYDGRTKGYWLKTRLFSQSELQLIIDGIQSSKFITQAKARDLTQRIQKLTDAHTRAVLNRQAVVANRIRNMNESVLDETGRLYRAIREDKKVSFRFFHYDREKKKQYSKSGGRYIVSPYAILWNDGNCYLYAYEEEKARFSHFRIDRMEDIRPLALPRVGKDEYKEKGLTARQPKIFNMFSGEECLVKLRCINRLADVMLDRFGREIILTPDDEAHFLVNVPVELSPPFYAWIASFGRQVKILSPEKVVNGMRDFLQKSMDMYKNDGKM